MASVYLGEGFFGPELAESYVARGSDGSHLACKIDEIFIYSRALMPSEVLAKVPLGANPGSLGVWESVVLDAGGPAIWEEISWRENAPFGDALLDERIQREFL